MYGRRSSRSSERVIEAGDSTAPFELTHLAPQDFIARAFDSFEIDAADISARVRFDLKRECDFTGGGIHVRHRSDLCESEARLTEAVPQRLFRSCNESLREDIARLDGEVLAKDFFRHYESASEFDAHPFSRSCLHIRSR
jgi:hypothetical protein